MLRRSLGFAVVSVSLMVLLAASGAVASTGRLASKASRSPGGKSSRRIASAIPADAPPGYQVVTSGDIDSPSGTEYVAEAICPFRTRVWGGGVYIYSSSLDVSVNRSYPDDSRRSLRGWYGVVDNNSDADTAFVVYAICAKKNAKWSIQQAVFSNPARSQSSGTVQCPPGTKVLSGGARGSGLGLGNQLINSSYPVKSGKGASATYGWTVRMNNYNRTDDSSVTVYAVCGSAVGYHLVKGPPVENDSGSQSAADIYCPSSSVPLGGGLRSSSRSIKVNLASSDPFVQGWENWENNASSKNATMTPYEICVG